MPRSKEIRNKSIIISLTVIGFFGIFSTTMSKNPVLPLFAKSLDSSEAVIGLIAAISPMAGIILSFPVGFLADRLGRKKLLVASAFVFLTAPLLYLVVTQAWMLIPIRFFHGIATAILGPVASAIICDAYPDTKGEKLGLYSSATLIGRTIAPLLGGVIISSFVFMSGTWNFRMVYAAAFIIAIPVFIFSLAVKENRSVTEIKKVTLGGFFHALADFITHRRLLGTSIIEMATYFTFGAFETYLPIHLANMNFPAYFIGTVFSVQVLSIALTKPLFGRLSDNVDRRGQIIAGILILGASFAALPFFDNIFAIIGIGIVFGLGMSLSTVATSTYVADVTSRENLGASMGALSSIMDIGHSSGPFVVGIIISAFASTRADAGYLPGFMACFILCVFSALLFAALAFTGNVPAAKRVARRAK